MCIKYELTC